MQYEGYIIDLDGTTYRGNEIIEGANEFIDYLKKENKPYLFLTNNSTYTQEAVVKKLKKLGIETTVNHVMTSSVATANYIERQNDHARCYMIGEEGLLDALMQKKFTLTDKNCHYVIVGLDRDITYAKLARATTLIREGATFIATNTDAAIPTEKGLQPGNGAIVSALTVSSGVNPLIIGKPEKIIMEEAIKQLGVEKENVLMIGDNYNTDIRAGINAGMDTLLVLTGFTSREDLKNVDIQPTYISENLIKWLKKLKGSSVQLN